jgi:hypothetical protein
MLFAVNVVGLEWYLLFGVFTILRKASFKQEKPDLAPGSSN